jgi:hypothetical protein
MDVLHRREDEPQRDGGEGGEGEAWRHGAASSGVHRGIGAMFELGAGGLYRA